LTTGSKCSISNERIRPDCRNAFFSWIAYLESISGRAAFATEVEEHTQFFSESCNTKEEGSCFWLGFVKKSAMSGLRTAPDDVMTSVLGGLLEEGLFAAL
jgi:hypothetical protein